MWRADLGDYVLRWDNLDRVIVGVGLVVCTVLAVLAGFMHQLAALGRQQGGFSYYGSLMERHGFSLIAFAWVGVVPVGFVCLAYSPRAWTRWVMLLVVFGAGWFLSSTAWTGFAGVFLRGMKMVM